MKTRHLLLIVLVIILAHAAVIFFCLQGGRGPQQEQGKDLSGTSAQTKNTPPAATAQQTHSPASVQGKPSPGQGRAASSAAGNSGRTVEERPLLRMKKKFPALSYAYSWQGSIPELPRSKGARAGILVDADTGRVLWHKKAQESFPIASMTKIMTLLLAYEQIIAPGSRVSLRTPVKVTYAAQRIGGSQVWLDTTETFAMEELMKAVSIKSANDAAYLIAEYLGNGSVYTFVERMNRRARSLGMHRTRFFNPHGLPGKTARQDNVSSPEDMVFLTRESLLYPQLMKWASTVRTHFRKPGTRGHLILVNHNNLLPGRRYPADGVDGLKTGVINRSGYCVSVTCQRNGHRMIAVVMGYDSARNRDLFVRQLLNWGYERRANPSEGLARTRKKEQELKNRRSSPIRRKQAGRRRSA